MPSFTYRRIVGASEARQDPSERLYLLLTSTAQKVGTFTLPASSTGERAITGLGFEPDVVIFTLTRSDPGLAGTSHKQYGVGCAGRDAEWSYGINVRHGTAPENFVRWAEDSCITLIISNKIIPAVIVEKVRATLDSFDADGFTLDVLEQSLGTEITVGYLALQGTFKVGTAEIPTTTGTQEISGIGFAPKAVWLAAAPGHIARSLVDPVYDRQGWDICNAFASVDGEQAMWGGARRSGVPNQSQSRWEETAFLLGLSSSGSTSMAVRARAALDAWLPDSFRLDWTTVDGVADYRFGYLAADEGEAGSFQIRSDGVDPIDVEVETRIAPEAMISTSTGMYGQATTFTEVTPDTWMIGGQGYLGLGANEPWVVEHNTSGTTVASTMDELCSALAQSSGGPSGGGFPTVKQAFRTRQQGFSYWHDVPAGSVDTTLTGQAFDVFEIREPLFIPSLNARIDAKRQGHATRALINPSGL